jgi:hypothetical protein
VRIDSTGPKISSCAMAASGTRPNTVGFTKKPFVTPSGRPVPPVTSSAPSVDAALDVGCTRSCCTAEASGPSFVSSRGSPTV